MFFANYNGNYYHDKVSKRNDTYFYAGFIPFFVLATNCASTMQVMVIVFCPLFIGIGMAVGGVCTVRCRTLLALDAIGKLRAITYCVFMVVFRTISGQLDSGQR